MKWKAEDMTDADRAVQKWLKDNLGLDAEVVDMGTYIPKGGFISEEDSIRIQSKLEFKVKGAWFAIFISEWGSLGKARTEFWEKEENQ